MTAKAGRLIKVGFKKNPNAWHTPVACGANDRLFLAAENLTGSHTVENLIDTPLGDIHPKDSQSGRVALAGSLDGWLRYDGNSPKLLAAVIGNDANTIITAGPEWLHTMVWQNTVKSIFWTLCNPINSDFVLEVPSVKVTGFTLSAAKGERVAISAPTIGDILNTNTDTTINGVSGSPVNTVTTGATITDSAEDERTVSVANGAATLNLSVFGSSFGASLGPIRVTDFNLTVTRTVTPDYVINDTTDGVDEPEADDYDVAQLSVTFSRTDADSQALLEAYPTHTKFFGKLDLVGAITTGGTLPFKYEIEFRHMMQVTDAVTTPGPGKTPQAVTFDLLADITTTHTGLRAGNPEGPLAIYLTNLNTADLLA